MTQFINDPKSDLNIHSLGLGNCLDQLEIY